MGRAAGAIVNGSWDAVVIGAGPSGSVAACVLADLGARTLLVERRAFPRAKVCGGCLAPAGVAALRGLGLDSCLDDPASRTLGAVKVVARRRAATIPVAAYHTIERRVFDARLVEHAVARGVVFIDSARARVSRHDRVAIEHDGRSFTLEPSLVVVADGLAGSALNDCPDLAWRSVARRGPIGLGATLDGPDVVADADAVTMHVSRHGYVGLARLNTGAWALAAAIDPTLVAERGPGGAVRAVLSRCSGAPTHLADADWAGVPPLRRRRRRLASGRVLVVGDAAGYVEPITGEGMSWGICCASRIGPFALRAMRGERVGADWRRMCERLLRRRQTLCRALCWASRKEWAADAAVRLASAPVVPPVLTRRMCWGNA